MQFRVMIDLGAAIFIYSETLSIDGFTNCKSDAYGTFTVQSGFTGKQGGSDKCQEMLGLNTFRANLTTNFQGALFLRLDLRLKLLAWINCSTV